MKKILYPILFAFLVLGSQSCQEVIDIELNDADKQYVIDGEVIEGVDSVVVRVTKTTSFFDSNPPETVDNADVWLTMPDLSLIELSYSANGYYVAHNLNITPASTYSLRVNVDNKEFTASSFMKPSLPLDSLEYEFNEGLFGGESSYSVFLIYQDSIGKDYYRIRSSVDGELLNEASDILVVDDNLNDGNLIRIPVFTHEYEAGDTVEAELQSIDAELYEFYQTFAAVASEDAGSPFSAAPANPVSNIKGGALGVFGAYTSSKRTIIIPE